MAVLGLQEAAERIETSKVDVWRAIQAGRLSAQRTEDGGIAIDPAELFRVFKPQQPDKRPVGQHATASLETSERPERIAQLSEPAGERAKADKAIAKCAALEESAKPWWRRLAHPRRPDSPEAPAGKTVEEDMAPALQEAPPQPDRLMPTCRSVVMPVLMPRATPIHNSARLHILEAYIETLQAENESLKRQLAATEKRVARETAKAEATIAEFSAITKRLIARAAERARRN